MGDSGIMHGVRRMRCAVRCVRFVRFAMRCVKTCNVKIPMRFAVRCVRFVRFAIRCVLKVVMLKFL